ncbi:hypothetical protein AC1031_015495 [Aphanomyces cochlioides]|nr:hypothetical protein AC1031_015495 [Aphanomyces cochlioides]
MNASIEFDMENRLVLSPILSPHDESTTPVSKGTLLSEAFPLVEETAVASTTALESHTTTADPPQVDTIHREGTPGVAILRDVPAQAPLNLHFSFNFDDNEARHDGKEQVAAKEIIADAAPPGDHARMKLKQGKSNGFDKQHERNDDTRDATKPVAVEEAARMDQETDDTAKEQPTFAPSRSETNDAKLSHGAVNERCESPKGACAVSRAAEFKDATQAPTVDNGDEKPSSAPKPMPEPSKADSASATTIREPSQEESTTATTALSSDDHDKSTTTTDNALHCTAPKESRSTEPLPSNPPPCPWEYTVENMYPVKWEDAVAPRDAPSTTTKTVKTKSSHKSFQAATMPVRSLELHALRESSSAEAAKLKVQLQCVTSELDAWRARFNRTTTELREMTKSMQDLQTDVATSRAERNAYAEQCMTLEMALRKAQSDVDEQRKNATAAQIDMHQLKARCSVLEGKLESMARERADAAATLDMAKQSIARMQLQADKLKEKVAKAESALSAAQAKHHDDVFKWKRKTEQLTHTATASIERAKKQLADQHTTKLHSVHVQLEKKERDAHDMNAILLRRNKALELKLDQAKARIHVVENQLRPMATMAKRLKALQDVEQVNKQLANEIQQLRRRQQRQPTSHRSSGGDKMSKSNKTPPSSPLLDDMPNPAETTEEARDDKEALDALEEQVAALHAKMAAQAAHVLSLRQLHAQELQAQAALFQRRMAQLDGVDAPLLHK